MAPDQQFGKYDVTARLFKIISQLPRDQQLILLKQLVGEDVATQLFKLIVEMSEAQQIILLEQMGAGPAAEMPVKTLSLEETGPTMREHSRRTCLINASYRIQDSSYRSYILDISIGGVFVEADEGTPAFPVGETVTLLFSIHHGGEPFPLKGRVAWSSPQGFGVKFDALTPRQDKAIRAFVEDQDR